MNRYLKTFLLWLLLAALPLQGIAAVQTSCGPMPHHGAAEVVMQAQAHHHDGDDLMDSAKIVVAETAGDSTEIMPKTTFCSACAACCVGAVALPSVPMSTPAYGSPLPMLVTPAALVTGFIPAGLERPPKRFTA